MLNAPKYQDDDALPGGDLHTGVSDVTFDDEARQLVLMKKGQRYVFRYDEGEEARVLEHVVATVQQDDSELDWFDAALLSHQMGLRISSQLNAILKPTGTDPWTP